MKVDLNGVFSWLALAATGSLIATTAAAQTPAPAAFAAMPSIESPAISADGRRLAFLSRSPEGSFVMVANIDDMTLTTVVDTADLKPRGVAWTSDDSLVFTAGATTSPLVVPGQLVATQPYGIDLGGDAGVTPLLRDRAAATRRGGGGGRGGPRGGGALGAGGAQLIGYERSAGRVLYPKFDAAEAQQVLYTVDPKTDRQDIVDRGSRFTRDWVVDENGEPVFRIDYEDRSTQLTLLAREGRRWEIVVSKPVAMPELAIYGLDGDGRLVVGVRPRGEDRYGLYELSTETGDLGAPVLIDDRDDILGAVIDTFTNRVVGGESPTAGTAWFDAELAEHQALLNEAFPGERPRIVSWSENRERFIVVTESTDRPPAVYLYDAAAPSVDQIATTYTGLQGVQLPAREPYSFTARDGTTIPGYLTRPLGADGPTPLVVLPHGGPAARDVPGFDWMAHFLASRGYAVLQPNFRGSGGFGRAWEMAGFGQWGTGVMQHDLSDGVAALVEELVADPDRVCIVGASYGGYAALAGAVFTPDLYACAAGIAPVSDLVGMLGAEGDRRGFPGPAVGYWQRTMGGGDPATADERLRAASPAAHAGDARAPILLIHGTDDAVVPIAQSRAMEAALAAAGKPVELIELAGEDHWLSEPETRLATLQALDRFLASHLAD